MTDQLGYFSYSILFGQMLSNMLRFLYCECSGILSNDLSLTGIWPDEEFDVCRVYLRIYAFEILQFTVCFSVFSARNIRTCFIIGL